MSIIVSSIAAMAENRVIGKDGDLPWHISEDMKHFKRTTAGKPMIMGRKSFEAFPKPLPGRAHIVVGRSYDQTADDYNDLVQDGVYKVGSIEEGIKLGKKIAAKYDLDEIFITGGGEIYKQTMPMIDRLYLSKIHKAYDGDTVFPDFDWDDFVVFDEIRYDGDPSFTAYTLDKA